MRKNTNYEGMKKNLEPTREYTRTEAQAAMGVNAVAFSRLVKDNALWWAFSQGSRRDYRSTLYRGYELIAQIERVSTWEAGVRLAYDYLELSEPRFNEKYAHTKAEVFAKGNYLEALGGRI